MRVSEDWCCGCRQGDSGTGKVEMLLPVFVPGSVAVLRQVRGLLTAACGLGASKPLARDLQRSVRSEVLRRRSAGRVVACQRFLCFS